MKNDLYPPKKERKKERKKKKEEIEILLVWMKQALPIFSVFLVSLDSRNLC